LLEIVLSVFEMGWGFVTGGTDVEEDSDMPRKIDRDEVQRLVRRGAHLIEVLPREEYEEAHLPGARNLPLGELTRTTTSVLDRDRLVITYCYDYACDMSPRAAWRLETLGFGDVYHYVGGKADWMAAGLPIEGTAADLLTTGKLVRTGVPTCSLTTRVAEIRRMLEASDWSSSFVVNDERVVLGRIYRSRLGHDDQTAEEVMDPGPVTFRPDITVQEMAERMGHDELRTAPITTSDGRLLGLLLREDVERRARDRVQQVGAASEG
jgi:rhodanese-related sulfurtransferase/CBS domain-containing protein